MTMMRAYWPCARTSDEWVLRSFFSKSSTPDPNTFRLDLRKQRQGSLTLAAQWVKGELQLGGACRRTAPSLIIRDGPTRMAERPPADERKP
jgi:hypothetical protein